jgi:hypothetical protein
MDVSFKVSTLLEVSVLHQQLQMLILFELPKDPGPTDMAKENKVGTNRFRR